jgi:hypothetical protein
MSHTNIPKGFPFNMKTIPKTVSVPQQNPSHLFPAALQAAIAKAKAQAAQPKPVVMPKASSATPIHFNVDSVPTKGNLKARKDDPKMAEKLADYRQKYVAQQNSSIQRKLDSMTTDKLPMTLNVAGLTADQKTNLVAQLQGKGYDVEAPKPRQHAQRQANAQQVANARANTIAAKKAERAAQAAERAKNQKNIEDANKENAADAAKLAQKTQQPNATPVAKPNATHFPGTKKVDYLIIK